MNDELHSIALEASTYFVRDKRSFSDEALGKLTATLEGLHGKAELGPALASLVQVAQHLDLVEKAPAAAMALISIATAQTHALEELNQKAKLTHEDEARQKRKAFNKFSGMS